MYTLRSHCIKWIHLHSSYNEYSEMIEYPYWYVFNLTTFITIRQISILVVLLKWMIYCKFKYIMLTICNNLFGVTNIILSSLQLRGIFKEPSDWVNQSESKGAKGELEASWRWYERSQRRRRYSFSLQLANKVLSYLLLFFLW